MGLMSGLSRLLLVIINIVFLLIGLAITAVGFLLQFGGDFINGLLDVGTTQLRANLEKSNIPGTGDLNIDLTEITGGLAIGLIVGGLILTSLCIFGCCGACYKIKTMLFAYGIIIAILLIAEIIIVSLLYGKPDIIKTGIKESVKQYTGIAGTDMVSLAWNVIMMQFKCCGVDSYEDFTDVKSWDRTVSGKYSAADLTTPIACCKELPDLSVTSLSALDCAKGSPINESISYGNKGCFDAIWEVSFANMAIAVPVLVITGIVQIAFIVFVVIIVKSDSDKVNPI